MSGQNSYQIGGCHYIDMHIQPWDAMEAWSTEEEFIGYLKNTAISYLARAGNKDEVLMEYRKAHHVLSKLIEFMENRPLSNSIGENTI